MLRYVLIMCAVCISHLLSAQTLPDSYTIYDTRTGQPVAYTDMLQTLGQADVVIFGEEHNDSIGHLLEHDLLVSLYALHQDKLALSMEMFETDVQGIMNEFLAGWISEKNFKKESRAWSNYDDYRPLLLYAQAHQVPVVCANAPARYTNMVTRKGLTALMQLPKSTQKAYLPPLPVDTLSGTYYAHFTEMMGGHHMPHMHLYQSQNLWDAAMAHAITQTVKQKKVVLQLNGRFHSDNRLGTAYRVIRALPKKDVRTISCFRGTTYEATEHQSLADFVILTHQEE